MPVLQGITGCSRRLSHPQLLSPLHPTAHRSQASSVNSKFLLAITLMWCINISVTSEGLGTWCHMQGIEKYDLVLMLLIKIQTINNTTDLLLWRLHPFSLLLLIENFKKPYTSWRNACTEYWLRFFVLLEDKRVRPCGSTVDVSRDKAHSAPCKMGPCGPCYRTHIWTVMQKIDHEMCSIGLCALPNKSQSPSAQYPW